MHILTHVIHAIYTCYTCYIPVPFMFNLQGLNSADTKLVQADKAKDAKAKAEAKEPAKEDPKAKLPGATAGELDMI